MYGNKLNLFCKNIWRWKIMMKLKVSKVGMRVGGKEEQIALSFPPFLF